MNHPVFITMLTDKQTSAMKSHNPTLIGCVGGYRFYEHPLFGDEAPLLAENEDGAWGNTHHFEPPSVDEIVELTQA